LIECGFIVKACPAHQPRTDAHPKIELGHEAWLGTLLSARTSRLLKFVLSRVLPSLPTRRLSVI
jgi:hypothetical protein